MRDRPLLRGTSWLHAAWEAASDALALSGADGRVLAANPAYFRLYGYSPEEILGQSFAIIFPEDRRAEAEAQYREVFQGTAEPPEYEAVVRRRDGTERIVAARVSFVEEDGRRVAMLNVIRDVTNEVAARRAAEEDDRARRSFLSSVAHDVKNPLAAMRGHAQMLRRITERTDAPPAPGQLMAGLLQIESSAARLAQLVDELVEVASLATGELPPARPVPCDAVKLVRDASARHEQLADQHRFVVETAAGTLPACWDIVRIERVLDNLLSNAVKYSPGGGTITIRVAPAAAAQDAGEQMREAELGANRSGVCITVADQGIGIAAADLPYIFDRYRRGTNVGPTLPGSGVGLTSVKHIVEQHGGRIDVTSREGEGTTARVWLPLEPFVQTGSVAPLPGGNT